MTSIIAGAGYEIWREGLLWDDGLYYLVDVVKKDEEFRTSLIYELKDAVSKMVGDCTRTSAMYALLPKGMTSDNCRALTKVKAIWVCKELGAAPNPHRFWRVQTDLLTFLVDGDVALGEEVAETLVWSAPS